MNSTDYIECGPKAIRAVQNRTVSSIDLVLILDAQAFDVSPIINAVQQWSRISEVCLYGK